MDVPGRDMPGVHFAMDYLVQQNRRNAGLPFAGAPILAAGRHVIVIGGGDTGSDCVGTANRQGAASVTQLEILPEPPRAEDKGLNWPRWPMKLRTSSSQEEGATRIFSAVTTRVDGVTGAIRALHFERDGESFEIPADLILLAMGFTGPPPGGVVETAGVEIARTGYATSRDRIFACGDMRRGQSLVVWAIREGRECANKVDHYLRAQDASL
jgi:glutamate synthase (NADPH/NADH) small chain